MSIFRFSENYCLFTQYFDPYLTLIAFEKAALKVVTFMIPSITFKQKP